MTQQLEITHQLSAEGVAQFQSLRDDAVRAVAARFHATYAAEYARFGARGREATREDLEFHLEFLRPVLEFGLLQSMVDYLRWTDGVLAARAVPVAHLALSIEWLAEYFASHMGGGGTGPSWPVRCGRRATRIVRRAQRPRPPWC